MELIVKINSNPGDISYKDGDVVQAFSNKPNPPALVLKVNGANCGYTFYKAATKLEEEIP